MINKLKHTAGQYRYFSNVVNAKIKPVVTIAEGRLRGAADKLFDGSTYYSFKGIPYALPPVGSFRFKDPVPCKPWTRVCDAIEHGPSSSQVDLHTGKLKIGSEDCLYLNVYTPSLQPSSKLPVIVYIHGGAFKAGSGDSAIYGPKFLIKHDVLLVTLNYRLEAFGFLCMDSPSVPGNAGLKDQVVALRWVQRNIAQFGGDPNNVTIMGESAGGVSVTCHLCSSMTEGLFHKAITKSGVFLLDWAIDRNAKARAIRVGKHLGINTSNPDQLLKYLQSVEAAELVDITVKISTFDENYKNLPIHFTPVVEKNFENVKSYLNEDPLSLLKSGKAKSVPTIVGYSTLEGLIVANKYLDNIEIYNKKPSYFLPDEIRDKVSYEKVIEFGKRIKKFYFDGKDINKTDVSLLVNLLSDIHSVYGANRFADFYAEKNDSVYMYRFDCVSELNYLKYLTNFSRLVGACHGDIVFYTFDNPMNKEMYKTCKRLRDLIETVTRLWTNFAKTGNPTPDDSCANVKWLPYSKANRRYLSIEPKPSMIWNADEDRLEFWRKNYEEAGIRD